MTLAHVCEHYENGWHNSPLLRKWERDPVETFLTIQDKEPRYNHNAHHDLEDSEGKQTFTVKLPKAFQGFEPFNIQLCVDHSRFLNGWLIGKVTLQYNDGTELHYNGQSNYGDLRGGTLTLTCTPDHTTNVTDSIPLFVMGPILGYRGTKDSNYQLCCLVATEGPTGELQPMRFTVTHRKDFEEAIVIVEGETAKLTSPLGVSGNYKLWRYDWEVPRHASQDYECRYTLPDGRSFVCIIPSFNTYPRIVFGSCAGFKTQKEVRMESNSNIMWTHMRIEHAMKPFHLLVMCGDQVYADPILVKLAEERKERGIDETDTTGLLEEARAKYFELYISRWRQPEQAFILSRIPSLMMWDDHEILDGWGSFEEVTPFMNEMYEAARENFILFQLRGLREEPSMQLSKNIGRHSVQWLHPPTDSERNPRIDRGPFTYIVTFGDVCFMMLDNRSERTIDQIMSEQSRQEFVDILKALDGFKHMFIVVGIPLIFANVVCLLSIVKDSPIEYLKNASADIHDRWNTPQHVVERNAFCEMLLDFSKETKTAVTVLSGDVHVGCWGRLKSESGVTVDMMTSSAIVNNPPKAVKFALSVFSTKDSFHLAEHGKIRMQLDKVDDVDGMVIARQNFVKIVPERTEMGHHTGRYYTEFVKKPKEIFGKPEGERVILRRPEKVGRFIESCGCEPDTRDSGPCTIL
ncbi:uncharacterized protein [Ptychodera flava]|uniref:uncharacterized protein n=1 Tax=Ptychodera flava TaxID=63121 RepID=UPI003969E984